MAWRRPFMLVVSVAVLALALAGCGIRLAAQPPVQGRGAGSGAGATRKAAQPKPVDNEVPTPPGKAEHAEGAPTPTTAVRTFAHAYINWSAADVAKHLRTLARGSVGQARTELQLEAAETKGDSELHSGGVANSGAVEAVSRLRGTGGGDRYVVVTLERTSASASSAYEGLAPAWHVAVATVRPGDQGHRWVVSGWQPES